MNSFTVASLIVLVTLCAGFLPTHAEEEDDDNPLKALAKESIEHCKDKLSDENKELLKKNRKADNREIRCFQACVLNHVGALKDTKFDMDKIKQVVNDNVDEVERDDWIAAINVCREDGEKETDECDVAGAFVQCFNNYEESDEE
uniref:Odorant-binding protein 4 n=1 Tax=Aulacocentrum confusum TaxID=2767324 RepID=A0A7G8Z905_9HYME|nr:odorant-binding protein 4 [Aulacocentrum confusum]